MIALVLCSHKLSYVVIILCNLSGEEKDKHKKRELALLALKNSALLLFSFSALFYPSYELSALVILIYNVSALVNLSYKKLVRYSYFC